jgi:hypothetical protein
MATEPVEQVLGRRLFLSSPFPLWRRVRGRVGREAAFQDLRIAVFEVGQEMNRQVVLGRAGLADSILDFQEQIDHLSGPRLLVLLVDEDQVA